MEIAQIELSRLRLNPYNDRHGPLRDEASSIQWLLDNRKAHMRALSQDLAKTRRLYERPLVRPEGDGFVVFDGNPNGARALQGKQAGNGEAVAKIKANSTQRASNLRGIVSTLQASGLTSVRSIAGALNDQGIRAPRGETWHPTAVSRLLTRLSAHDGAALTQTGAR
jgi:Recombinase